MNLKDHVLTDTTKSNFQTNIIIAKFLMLLVAVVLLFLCSMCTPTNAAPTNDESTIKITYPLNESIVIQDEAIFGTSANIPDGYQVWILGYSYNGDRYYPNPESGSIPRNGEWSIPIEIGSDGSTGAKYDIIAMLADTEANAKFEKYVADCKQNNNWPGTEKENIPVGSVEYDRITVTRSAKNPEIKITYPLNESTVNQYENINGTSANIPDGYQIWILGYSSNEDRYYPNPESGSIPRNGKWSIPIEIGSDGSTGAKYDIIAMLADTEANAKFEKYVADCKQNNNWPGTEKENIPVGSVEYDRINVTRIRDLLLVADFTANPSSGYAPLAVQFTDISQNAAGWTWDFGDGATSNEQNPSHIYSTEGTYNVNLVVSNANGTSPKSATITVQSQSSSDGGSSGGSSPSSGSSGGGGGGGSPEPQSNVEVKEISQTFVGSGNSVKFDFPKNATSVVYVSFDSKKTAGKTTTIVEMLKGKSTRVSGLPSGEVYKSLNIWVGNSGFATSKNIENAVVCFKVEKSWIQDQKIDQSSITLNRYNDTKWNSLPTSLLSEDDKYVYFTAETPGFSPFAITGKVNASTSIVNNPTGNISNEGGENNKSQNLSIEKEETKEGDSKTKYIIITLSIVAGVAIWKLFKVR